MLPGFRRLNQTPAIRFVLGKDRGGFRKGAHTTAGQPRHSKNWCALRHKKFWARRLQRLALFDASTAQVRLRGRTTSSRYAPQNPGSRRQVGQH